MEEINYQNALMLHLDSVCIGKTLDLATPFRDGGFSQFGSPVFGVVNQDQPDTIHLANYKIMEKAFKEEQASSRLEIDNLKDDPERLRELSSSCSIPTTQTPYEFAINALNHELGHSDFVSSGQKIDQIFPALTEAYLKSEAGSLSTESPDWKQVLAASAQQYQDEFEYKGMLTDTNETVMKQDIAGFMVSRNDGNIPLSSEGGKALQVMGMTKYGCTSLQEMVAECHALWLNERAQDLVPPIVGLVAKALNWKVGRIITGKSSGDVAKANNVGFGIVDTFKTPMVLTTNGYQPFTIDGEPITKGDVVGHPFHGNQYEQVWGQSLDYISSKAGQFFQNGGTVTPIDNSKQIPERIAQNLADISKRIGKIERQADKDKTDPTKNMEWRRLSEIRGAFQRMDMGYGKVLMATDKDGNLVGAIDYRLGEKNISVGVVGSTQSGAGTALEYQVARLAAENNLGVVSTTEFGSVPYHQAIGREFRDMRTKEPTDTPTGGDVSYWTAEKVQDIANLNIPTTKPVAKGDVQGHDFHGNQYVTAEGIANHSSTLKSIATRLAALSTPQRNDMVGTSTAHFRISAYHRRAAEELRRANMETAGFLESDAGRCYDAHLKAADAHSEAAKRWISAISPVEELAYHDGLVKTPSGEWHNPNNGEILRESQAQAILRNMAEAPKALESAQTASTQADELSAEALRLDKIASESAVKKGDLPGHPFRGNQYTDGLGSEQIKTAFQSPKVLDTFSKIMTDMGYFPYPQNHPLHGGCGLVAQALLKIYPQGQLVAFTDPYIDQSLREEAAQDGTTYFPFVDHYAVQVGDNKFVDANGEQSLDEMRANSTAVMSKRWIAVPVSPTDMSEMGSVATGNEEQVKFLANAILESAGKEPIAKGDFIGHPFRGNQWKEGAMASNYGSSKRTPRQSAPLPDGWTLVDKVGTTITLKSDAGNTAVFGSRGSWKHDDPHAHILMRALDGHSTGKTIDFSPKQVVKDPSTLAYVHADNPHTIEIMPRERLLKVFGNAEKRYGSDPELNALHASMPIEAETVNKMGYTYQALATPAEMGEAIICHELGHSDFFASGATFNDVAEAIAEAIPSLTVDRLAAFERDGFDRMLGRALGFEMPDGRVAGRAEAIDYLANKFPTMAPLDKSPLAGILRREGMVTEYGTKNLQELVAESRAMFELPSMPKTPMVRALAKHLGWTIKKAVGEMKDPIIRLSVSGGVTDGINGPGFILGDKRYDYQTGEWEEAFEDADVEKQVDPDEVDPFWSTPEGLEILELTKGDFLGHPFRGNQFTTEEHLAIAAEADKEVKAEEAKAAELEEQGHNSRAILHALRGVVAQARAVNHRRAAGTVEKGDFVGHPFRGNQYRDAQGAETDDWGAPVGAATEPEPPTVPTHFNFKPLTSTEIVETLGDKLALGGDQNNGFSKVRLADGSIGLVKHGVDLRDADAEVLSCQIAKALDLPTIETVILKEFREECDLLMPFVQASTSLSADDVMKFDIDWDSRGDEPLRGYDVRCTSNNPTIQHDFQGAHLLHAITGNGDDHPGNWMVYTTGGENRLVAIDNALAHFGSMPYEVQAAAEMYGMPTDEIVSRLEAMYASGVLSDSQRQMFQTELVPTLLALRDGEN